MSTASSTRLDPDRYLAAVAADAARFVDVLATVPDGTRVPTCPDWNVEDLLHHLGQVHHFWALVITTGVRDDAEAEALTPLPRPDDRQTLLDVVRGASGRLLDALDSTPADAEAWTWAPDDHTVGFIQRRQAHEACIHRLDAELTAAPDGSARTAINPMLATDGVDEALRLIGAAVPPEATVEPEEDRLVRVVASDTGTTWLATMTRVVVRQDGRPRASQGISVADVDPADGTVRPVAILSGTAEDLDCSFWGRPTLGDLHRTGDLTLLAEFEATFSNRPGG